MRPPHLEFDARLPGGVTFGVAEIAECGDANLGKAGNPVLGEVPGTVRLLFQERLDLFFTKLVI